MHSHTTYGTGVARWAIGASVIVWVCGGRAGEAFGNIIRIQDTASNMQEMASSWKWQLWVSCHTQLQLAWARAGRLPGAFSLTSSSAWAYSNPFSLPPPLFPTFAPILHLTCSCFLFFSIFFSLCSSLPCCNPPKTSWTESTVVVVKNKQSLYLINTKNIKILYW